MENPGLPEPLWQVLDGRLWHATGPDGLRGILADEEIRITGQRYENSLCRKLGCVALFDFGLTAVDRWNHFTKWGGWLGHQQNARVAIWLEIDRRVAAECVIDAGKMRRKWKKNLSMQCIPGVEAGHEGPVPLGSIGEVVLIDRECHARFECQGGVDEKLLQELDEFEQSLPSAPEPHPLISAREAYLSRRRTE